MNATVFEMGGPRCRHDWFFELISRKAKHHWMEYWVLATSPHPFPHPSSMSSHSTPPGSRHPPRRPRCLRARFLFPTPLCSNAAPTFPARLPTCAMLSRSAGFLPSRIAWPGWICMYQLSTCSPRAHFQALPTCKVGSGPGKQKNCIYAQTR